MVDKDSNSGGEVINQRGGITSGFVFSGTEAESLPKLCQFHFHFIFILDESERVHTCRTKGSWRVPSHSATNRRRGLIE